MAETISEALKIENGWLENTTAHIKTAFNEHDSISGIMEDAGKFVREKEFGEDIKFELSQYEKKLLMAGLIIGSLRARTAVNEVEESTHSLIEIFRQLKRLRDGEE